MSTENQARIVVDSNKNGQLQVEIDTRIQDQKRQEVLIYTALKSCMELEYEVSKMEASKIDVMYEAINNDGEASIGYKNPDNDGPPETIIVLPNELRGEAV